MAWKQEVRPFLGKHAGAFESAMFGRTSLFGPRCRHVQAAWRLWGKGLETRGVANQVALFDMCRAWSHVFVRTQVPARADSLEIARHPLNIPRERLRSFVLAPGAVQRCLHWQQEPLKDLHGSNRNRSQSEQEP